MPGLQRIVSAWTKINQDHLEYHSEYLGQSNGLHLQQGVAAAGGAHPGAQGGVPPEQGDHGGAGDGTGAGVGVDPRATVNFAPMPQPPLPSTSSLSSYSFSKGGVLQSSGGGGGTADTQSLTLTPTPPVRSGATAGGGGSGGPLAPRRYPLYHHGAPMLSSAAAGPLSAQQAPQQLMTRQQSHESLHAVAQGPISSMAVSSSSSRSTMSSLSRPSRRANHQHHHPHQHGHGALHSQLESYESSNHRQHTAAAAANFDSFPPPQAGADAILGRRKSVATGGLNAAAAGLHVGRNDSSLSSPTSAEPPATLSSNPGAATVSNPARGALSRSPSSSLWHSTRSSSESSSSVGGVTSVTASLDKIGASLRNGSGPPALSTSASIAELNAKAEDALQSMNSLRLMSQMLPTSSTPVQSNLSLNDHLPPHGAAEYSDAMPIAPQQRPGGGALGGSRGIGRGLQRQRLRKKHSRTDLVREMALDRSGQNKRGSLSSVVSGGGASTSAANNREEMDASTSSRSLLDDQLGQQQQHQQQPQPQEQLQSLKKLMTGSPPVAENNEGGMPLSGISDSGQNQGGRSRSTASNSVVNNASSLSRVRLQPLMNNHGGNLVSHGGLTDSLTSPAPHGGQWVPGFLPDHLLPNQRRQSSSGSSGTVNLGNLSGNMSLEKLRYQNGADNGTSGTVKMSSDTQTLPADSATPGNINAAAASPLPSKQPGVNLVQGSANCDRCAQMEATLLSLQADLEYLRTVDLQREFVCKECCENGSVHGSTNHRLERMDSSQHGQSLPPIKQNTTYPTLSSDRSVTSAVSIGSRGSRTSSRLPRRKSVGGASVGTGGGHRTQATNFASRTSMFLRDASKRLSDLSTRHKRQVKQTTHERAYWQNDMHLKLEKFAMMCKNLNEEAAHRVNEVKETKALLDKMTGERNALISQVDTLRARVELYEAEGVEQSQLREEWAREKAQLLESIDAAVKSRDGTADDLSSRLTLAVETIENERKQQRMRRQIIFPSSRPSFDGSGKTGSEDNTPSSPNFRPNQPLELSRVDDLERIQKSKEVAEKAQMSLRVAMVQSAAREKAMKLKLGAMERELAEARAVSEARSEMEGIIRLEGGGMRTSMRKSCSTTSLGSAGAL